MKPTPGTTEFALFYPFDLQHRSFVYTHERNILIKHMDEQVIHCEDDQAIDLTHLIPVLAIGSNSAPLQLKRKFSHDPTVCIPVIRATLFHYDVVFASYITSYGSIPATVIPSPGVQAQVYVIYLTEAQLIHMHETESLGIRYAYEALPNAVVKAENGLMMQNPFAYVALSGSYSIYGFHVPLYAIKAKGRRAVSYTEREMLSFVHEQMNSEDTLENWIHRAIQSQSFRDTINKYLEKKKSIF